MSTLRDIYGLACPSCKQAGMLEIAMLSLARLTPEGWEFFGDSEWEDGSHCRCPHCGYTAAVSWFKVKPVAGGSL